MTLGIVESIKFDTPLKAYDGWLLVILAKGDRLVSISTLAIYWAGGVSSILNEGARRLLC